MKKKKIYFLAPTNKGGTYYYYKKISEYLIQNHSDTLDVYFVNSLIDYIKLHFTKTDYIFSIIPFFFKPIFAKRYIFNLHGNFKIERKNNGLGVKLLYLSELNLLFSDKIMLTSFYLADKLKFKEKYNDKIIIIPNFVEKIFIKNKQLEKNAYNFMTITSFKFYKKGKGIINLGNVIKSIANQNLDKNIKFTIIGNEENSIFYEIKNEFDKINFGRNIDIVWKGWLKKEEIEKEFLMNNTFVYWTKLDNYPGVILDALNYNLRVYTNNYESFKYFLDDKIICRNEDEMVYKVLYGTDKIGENCTYSIIDIINIILKEIGK